jgi:acetoin utilization deacetylase AcuC-like enzyme
MPLTVFHHPGFFAPIGSHIMPIGKFALVADALRDVKNVEILAPQPVEESDLRRVHTDTYIEAIRTGQPRELAESQKFPWSPELYPSVCLTNGGVLAAATLALKTGISAALASGFHHSGADHGEGFCTFNGLVVALEALRDQGQIRTAAVLDMDLHYGNGTASLAASRPWLRALSLYGNDYSNNTAYRDVTMRRHQDGPNHFSVPLAPSGGPDGTMLLDTLEKNLGWLTEKDRPDIILYQAGADPLKDDPYSPLDLTHEDLQARDKMVFEFAKEAGIPLAWVLAGGYTKDVNQVVRVHVNTALACLDVYGGN